PVRLRRPPGRVVALSALRWLGLVVAGGVAGLAVLAEAEGAGPSDLALGWVIAAPVAVAAVTAVDWPRVSHVVGDLDVTATPPSEAASWRGPARRLRRGGRSGPAAPAGGPAGGRPLPPPPRRRGV